MKPNNILRFRKASALLRKSLGFSFLLCLCFSLSVVVLKMLIGFSVVQLSFFIEFTGVTLVNNIMWVSGVQFYVHHLYTELCVHHPSQVSFHHHSSPFTFLHLPHPFPLAITALLPVSMRQHEATCQ